MKEKKSGKITLANIIAMLGLVLLIVCLWLGQALRSGELGGMSVLISVGITIAAALLLWLMIKAKGAETNTSKWKIIEFGTLVLYLALAVLTAPIALNFFSVLSNKDKLQDTAQNDIESIQKAIDNFKQDEKKNLGVTTEGLNNVCSAKASNETPDNNVIEFIKNENIASNFSEFSEKHVSKWKSTKEGEIESIDLSGLAEKDLDGVEAGEYGSGWEERIATSKNAIRNWQLLKIPSAIGNIQSLSEEVGKTLTAFSKNAPFPEINNESGIYKIIDERSDKGGNAYETKSKVQDMIKDLSPFTVMGIGAMVLIHLLILFNYFMAYRTQRMNKKQSENDGGIVLNI